MEKSRPFGVTLMAILAGLGAIAAIIHTLQLLHLWPISLTFGGAEFKFFTFNIFGAILWGVLALIWIWVVMGLWNLNPSAWLFVVVMAILNLILAGVTILGATAWQDMMWAIVINVVILVYCLLPGTKDAFEIE
ncbi:MAG: hypothetical protein ACK2UL_01525 [Anaerolineae bacterium]|jgi:hypothetical protein